MEMERAGKNLKSHLTQHWISSMFLSVCLGKKANSYNFSPAFQREKVLMQRFVAEEWELPQKKLTVYKCLHVIEWEEYSSVNTAKQALNLQWDIDETAKAGFVIHWLTRTHSESASCTLFSPFLTAHDTYFHFSYSSSIFQSLEER